MKQINGAGGYGQVNRQFLKIAVITMASLMLSTIAPEAFAQATGGIVINANGKVAGTLATNVIASLRQFALLFNMVVYFGALWCAWKGVSKWKEHGLQPDRTPIKEAVTYFGAMCVLAAMPEFLGTGVASLWGSGAQVITQP